MCLEKFKVIHTCKIVVPVSCHYLDLPFFFFLAMPAAACGSFQARDQIHAIEVTRATAVQCQILNLLSHQETPGSSIFT